VATAGASVAAAVVSLADWPLHPAKDTAANAAARVTANIFFIISYPHLYIFLGS